MTKNKFLISLCAICCGLFTCIGLTSCGGSDDDDDFSTKDTGDNRELYSAEVTYKVSLGKNELDAYDVNVTYLDKEGAEHSMAMKDTTWTWKCNLVADDVKDEPKGFELRVKPTRKENLNLDPKANYEVGIISKIIIQVKNKAGRVICECDGLGLKPGGFSTFTGEQLNDPWSDVVSGWFSSLTNTNKSTLTVYSNKIKSNGMTQKYW